MSVFIGTRGLYHQRDRFVGTAEVFRTDKHLSSSEERGRKLLAKLESGF